MDGLLESGDNVILELEVDGSFAIQRRRPDAVLIFIDAPLEELDLRLRRRATEMAGEIEQRLRIAREQLTRIHKFDAVIVNDDVERAAQQLCDIMRLYSAPVGLF